MPIDFDDEREPVNYSSLVTTIENRSEKRFINESGDKMEGDLDLSNHRLKNVKWPEHEKDAVPRNFVTYSCLNFNQACDCYTAKSKRLTEVADCTSETDAVNKKTLDSQLAKCIKVVPNSTLDLEGMSLINLNLRNLTVSYRKISAPLDCNDNKIINLHDCTDPRDAANKKYVDQEITKSKTASMTGTQINDTIERKILLALNNVPSVPVSASSATSRVYVSSFCNSLIAQTNVSKLLALKIAVRLPSNSRFQNKTYSVMISNIEIGQINNTDQITYSLQIPQYVTEYQVKINEPIINVISGHMLDISFEIITNANSVTLNLILFLYVFREPIQSINAEVIEVVDGRI